MAQRVESHQRGREDLRDQPTRLADHQYLISESVAATPPPTSSTTPAASNPVRYGNVVGTTSRSAPERIRISPGEIPDARTATRTSPGPACGSGTSATCTTLGGPYSLNWIALMPRT